MTGVLISRVEKPVARRRRLAHWLAAVALSLLSGGAGAQRAASAPAWIELPHASGHLQAGDLGLIVNTADPYSVEVGRFYAEARQLSPQQILYVELPHRPQLTPEEFAQLQQRIASHFGPETQALALAWTQPYAVACNSITGALALGFDADLCARSCAPSRPSRYFASASVRPYTDFGLRPSMLLAARDVEGAKAMIRRGVASDRTLGWRGAPPAQAYFVSTGDRARSVRSVLFPPAGRVAMWNVQAHVSTETPTPQTERLLLYETGLVRVDGIDQLQWLPGALADHLTSSGGALDERSGQMSALAWIAAGATASYGTVSEPCNHLQKFPHPQVLLQTYARGATAIEAYWKSVGWPQQGLFIGEPLAAPFAR